MRLAAAVTTAAFVYLAVGFMTGGAPKLDARKRERAQVSKAQRWLIQAGSDLTPRQFVAGSVLTGLVGFLVLRIVVGTWWVALVPAMAIAVLPYAHYSRQRAERLAAVQKAWPDGLREVLAQVNSGATLAAAIEALANRGPDALQRAFSRFPAQATMFGVLPALGIIKEELADPVSDKVIEVLALAHQFGGSNLQVVLRDLIDTISADLLTTEQIRTAGLEQRLEALVVALAPWLILLFLATVPDTYREFYRSQEGRFVVIIAAVWGSIGLILMKLIGKTRHETRVFGGGAVATPVRGKGPVQ